MLPALLRQTLSALPLLVGADCTKRRLAYPIWRTDTGRCDHSTHVRVAYQKCLTELGAKRRRKSKRRKRKSHPKGGFC